MTKCADLGLKRLFCTNSCTLVKSLKGCAPSAKMTKRADLGLKTLLKTLKSGVPSPKIRKRADIGLKTLLCTNRALC